MYACLNIPYLIYVVYIVSSLVLPHSHYFYHLSLKEVHETHLFPIKYITTLLDLETINIALMVCLEATVNRKSQKQKHGDHGRLRL